jgi:hypothetical protein
VTCAAAQAAKVDEYGNDQPYEIDALEGHVVVDFPGVDDGGDRRKEEAENRVEQLVMEGALQIVGKEPHQKKYDAGKEEREDDE